MSIFINEPISEKAIELIKKNNSIVDNFDHPEQIEGIILSYLNVDDKLMDKCKNLKVIAKHGVGCDSIDLKAAKERGITVVNTPKANMRSVAEFIVALILDCARNITLSNNKTSKGDFRETSPFSMTGFELAGKTLGLVGLGNIAREVADILTKGFNMNVIAYDPYANKDELALMGIKVYDDLGEMIENADIVNVSVPLTEDTKNLISGEIFDRFKEGAVLINAARGGIVNEDDLYEALSEGKLAAAACDCFVNEPPTRENTKLLELDNFIATPHIAAVTKEALERMAMGAASQVLEVLDGKEPQFRVV